MYNTIALDIDNTLHDFVAIAQREGAKLGCQLDYQDNWEDQVGDELLDLIIENSLTDSNILCAQIYPYAKWALDKLAKKSLIYVVSRRSTKCHNVTEKWLKYNKIPYFALICTEDKLSFFKETDCSIVIDDWTSTIQDSLSEGYKVATLVYPWNINIAMKNISNKNFIGAHNWLDIYEQMKTKNWIESL